MKPLNRILVATDFSPAADRAVRRAALIAKQHGAELHLLHVVHPLSLYPGQSLDPEPLDKAAVGAAGERLGSLAKILTEHYGIRTHAAYRFGRAHTRIAEYAQEAAVDLVVAGARGESTMRLLLGSTTQRLLRVWHGPALVVRNAEVEPYRRVLAAVDFSRASSAVLTWARRLAGKERTDVAHVIEPELDRRLPESERERAHAEMRHIAECLMRNLLADAPGEHAVHIEMGDPSARLLELAQAWRCDLIVLGRHGQEGLEEFLLGSVSKDLVQAADCDVLVAGAE